MDTRLQAEKAQFGTLLEQARAYAEQYLTEIESRPAAAILPAPFPASLPETGVGTLETLQLFQERFGGKMAATNGARYWGFVTGGTTPAALVGDWLSSTFDTNLSDRTSSVAAHIEDEALRLLRDLFTLPDDYHGVFVSGATMANFVALATAREWAGQQRGISLAEAGLYGQPPIPILSAEPHSSTMKSLAMAGMGRTHLQRVAQLPNNREAMDMDDLRRRLAALDGSPSIVVASAGTVNTGDFDDFVALGQLKTEFPFWFHVDGAFGGFAACSPHYAHLIAGIEAADSITIDAHKWLNVPYDSAMVFTRYPQIQSAVFRNSAAYLDTGGDAPDFLHFTPENSRRLRALPAWFTLLAYGKAGYRDIVERNIANAQHLSAHISASDTFRLLAPTRLNIVCFTLTNTPTTATIRHLLNDLREDGRVFMTPTVFQGVPGIRAAFVNWRTTAEDVDIGWAALQEMITHLQLSPMPPPA